jgi:cytoskeleton protein RodZ
MGSIASDLKSEREKRKVSLNQIAADTRISLHYLESLEEGRYSDLPGGMYNRAFLRAYCESLNLDQREIIRRYEAEISPLFEKPLKPKSNISTPNSSSRLSPVIIWSLMLLISATGIYYSRKWIKAVFSPYFSRAPVASVRFERQPRPFNVPPAGERAAPIVPPALESSTAPDSSTAAPFIPSQPPPPSKFQETQAQAPAIPASGESIATPNSSTAPLRLEIVVTQLCWISVDRDGHRLIRRLLEPGEVQSLTADEEFFLIIGNAGGIHLKINGKPAKPIGKQQEVVRLLITEKNLPDLIDKTAG